MASLSGFGKIHAHRDPRLEAEFSNIYRLLQSMKITADHIDKLGVAEGLLPRIDELLSISERLDFIHIVDGTPEGAIPASVGHVALRTDSGTGTTLYVKESGSGNTGWVAK